MGLIPSVLIALTYKISINIRGLIGMIIAHCVIHAVTTPYLQ